jgi:Kef-type K+ transport system membrane component KefB
MPPMDAMLWVPQWPSQFSLLTAAAIMLIAGVFAARLLSPTLRIPEITAFLLCGLVLGPSGLSLISADSVAGLSSLADLALGLILFELGRRIDPVWLIHERWLLLTAFVQGVAVYLGLTILLIAFGVDPMLSLMAAALGCASSPAITLRVVHEIQSEGQVTERMLHSVAISCLLGFSLFTVSLQSLHIAQDAPWFTSLSHPAYLLVGSTLLGWIASRCTALIATVLGRRTDLQFLLVFGFVALLVEANELLRLSPLISLLIFGITSRAYGRRQALQSPNTSTTSFLVFAFLFVYLGSTLVVDFNATTLLLGLAFVMLRLIILMIPPVLLHAQNGLSVKKAALWGSALLPVSSVSIVMVNHAANLYPDFGTELSHLIASVLLITHAIGPLVTWWSLRLSGEGKHHA